VTAPLLDLASHLRQRLVRALETGQLGAPYSEMAVRNALGGASESGGIRDELEGLHARGINGTAVAYAIKLAAEAESSVSRPDLVWSGPEVRGLHARDTRAVFEELVGGAQTSLWISSYTYYDGPKAFELLARRMDQVPGLQTTLLLNIKRGSGDSSPSDELVRRFTDALWTNGWPGTRRPDVFYDPRSLLVDSDRAVLHAKAVVADDGVAFVTSANLTEKAFDENIEVGVLSRDRALATSLSKHFRVLIERELLLALPTA
jgi:phosphatidylserine/phosphatidylglycerophosphate/cardiolipin synthase-like enzyme